MSKPDRDWSLVHYKLEARVCRACGLAWQLRPGVRLERAHVIGREHDFTVPLFTEGIEWRPGVVVPHRIIPLCGPATDTTTCHGMQHARRLNVLPLLSIEEQLQAVADAGGIGLAMAKLMPLLPELLANSVTSGPLPGDTPGDS